MKLKTEPLSASSQPGPQTDESCAYIVSHERVPGTPLSEESRKQLDALADLEDEDIDYSDIPPLPDDFFKNAVRGWLPLETHTLTLALDAEVYDWLIQVGTKNARVINHVLRREMQQSAAATERNSRTSIEHSPMSKAS